MGTNQLFTKEELIAKFGWEEYFVFALMLAVSAGIGLFFWWKGQKNNGEFLMGGKSMGVFPMSLSLLASFISAITLLGTPAEVYVYGTQYCVFVLCFPIVAYVTANWFLPVFYELGVSTSYEYLEWRFDKSVRTLASACFLLQMVIYMSIVVFTPALALSQLTGFNVDLACVVIFIVCIFYTSIGGIKAVMWTDVFQTLCMFGSFLAVVIKGSHDAGGAAKVFDLNYQTGRIELFNFSLDPTTRHSVWALIIGGTFLWLTVYAINQAQVQRYLTVPTKEMAQRALWYNAIGIITIVAICGYAGLVIFAYYQDALCDPIKSKLVKTRDQLFPLFVMQVFGDVPFLPGLFVAGVFSGALSSVSSGLNALAAATIQDFIHGVCKFDLSERMSFFVTQGLAIVYGILSFCFVYVVKYVPGVLQASITIFGVISGPVLGCFILGMFFPWANPKGANLGILISFALSSWIGFGQTLARTKGTYRVDPAPTTVENCPESWNITAEATPKPAGGDDEESAFQHLVIYEISYMWFSMIPSVICVVTGGLISLATKPQDPKKLNPLLISPGFKGIFSWWPKKVRDAIDNIQIGADYVSSEKEERLKRKQILVPSKTAPEGLDHQHLEPHANPDNLMHRSKTAGALKGKGGEVNLAMEH